jgi:antitoxin (DNA-binding transcriptional repressor) of toxin-antitoxin stability system
MSETYSIHEAKTHLSRLIAAALAGKEVLIRRGQEPVVRLTPLKPAAKRVPGAFKGRIKMGPEFFEPLPEEELLLWEGRGDEIDASSS